MSRARCDLCISKTWCLVAKHPFLLSSKVRRFSLSSPCRIPDNTDFLSIFLFFFLKIKRGDRATFSPRSNRNLRSSIKATFLGPRNCLRIQILRMLRYRYALLKINTNPYFQQSTTIDDSQSFAVQHRTIYIVQYIQ